MSETDDKLFLHSMGIGESAPGRVGDLMQLHNIEVANLKEAHAIALAELRRTEAALLERIERHERRLDHLYLACAGLAMLVCWAMLRVK